MKTVCIYKFYPLGYILIIEAADEKSGAGHAFKDGLQLKESVKGVQNEKMVSE